MTVLPDLTNAPALTLLNPWGSAIAHGLKRVENRCWSTKYRGWVLIHAGKGWDKGALPSFCSDRGLDVLHAVVPSAVVAVADLIHVCQTGLSGKPCHCGPWAMPAQCHWQLGRVYTLPNPVPANGRQRLWRPGPDLIAAVTAELQDLLVGVRLVCNGRDNDGWGDLCGNTFTGKPGETRWLIEERARIRGWRLGPPGSGRHIMCPACAKPLSKGTPS